MLERGWLWAGRCVVTMGSVFVWAGCSGDASPTIVNDAGANDGAAVTPDGDASADPDAGVTPDAQADAGVDAGPTPTVDIVYGACPDFTPCGGDVKGHWTVSGGCLSEDTFAAAKKDDCKDVKESNVVIKASGTVDATDTTLHQKMTVDLSADIAIPKACMDSLGIGNCAFVEVGLQMDTGLDLPTFDEATCAGATGGGCTCSVAKKLKNDTESDYTVAGSTLTTDDGRTVDYCVTGNKTTFEETSKGNFPVVVELTR